MLSCEHNYASQGSNPNRTIFISFLCILDELFIRCLLKILEPLFPRIRHSIAFKSSEECDDNSNNSNASEADDNSIPPVENNDQSNKGSNGLDGPADTCNDSSEIKDAVLLYNVIQGFLRDMVESLPIVSTLLSWHKIKRLLAPLINRGYLLII